MIRQVHRNLCSVNYPNSRGEADVNPVFEYVNLLLNKPIVPNPAKEWHYIA